MIMLFNLRHRERNHIKEKTERAKKIKEKGDTEKKKMRTKWRRKK